MQRARVLLSSSAWALAFAAVMAVALLRSPGALAAGKVRPDSKIDSALISPGAATWATWVVDDGGRAWRAADGFGSSWTLYPELDMPGSPLVGPQGLAVAYWDDATGTHEWVYFVDTGGKLWEFRVEGPTRSLYWYAPPAGHTFTGRLEARSALIKNCPTCGLGARRVEVTLISTDSGGATHFVSCRNGPGDAVCEWTDHGSVGLYHTSSDISSEVWPGSPSGNSRDPGTTAPSATTSSLPS